jgi:acetolactate synthase-1/2/3 large subunit
MAVGDWIVSGRPAALVTTTGPGLANALNGLEAARAARAPFVLVSPLTPPAETNRLGVQETGSSGFASSELHQPGRLFDLVAHVHAPVQLDTVFARIAAGLAADPAFTAHIAIPTDVQASHAPGAAPVVPAHARRIAAPSSAELDALVAVLASERVAVWVGFGARKHGPAVRRLVDTLGVPVLSSPRGAGVADRCATFVGQTGNGGHEQVHEELARYGVERILVLGSRLGAATSGWDERLVPPNGFIQVDHDRRGFAIGYPQAPTVGIEADIGRTVEALLAAPLPPRAFRRRRAPRAPLGVVAERRPGVVHPEALMRALQHVIVDGTDLPFFADASSAMFWSVHSLEFGEGDRLHLEGTWGSMGFAGAAVVGAAMARGGPVCALCGDAAMHMQDEINTAVKYGIPSIWVILSNGGPSIVRFGMEANGRPEHDGFYPDTDFAAVAIAKGAQGLRVTREEELEGALRTALAAGGPFVVDVVVDPTIAPPIAARTGR